MSDDVVLKLSQPSYSLPILQSVLKQFENISGYKVNEPKPVLIGLLLPLDTEDLLDRISKASWKESIQYLGIKLLKSWDPSTMFKANYASLISQVHSQLNNWSRLKMSWFGWDSNHKSESGPKIFFFISSHDLSIVAEKFGWDIEFVQWACLGK